MKLVPAFACQKHVLVCTNDRPSGESCCSKVGGYEVFRALKDFVKSNGLSSRVYVTRTGCLGFCNDVGAMVVIYPEKACFTHVTKDDLPALFKRITG